ASATVPVDILLRPATTGRLRPSAAEIKRGQTHHKVAMHKSKTASPPIMVNISFSPLHIGHLRTPPPISSQVQAPSGPSLTSPWAGARPRSLSSAADGAVAEPRGHVARRATLETCKWFI